MQNSPKGKKRKQNEVKYFTIKEGEIYSCVSDAKNMNEAIEAIDFVGADSAVAITKETAKFIIKQFKK